MFGIAAVLGCAVGAVLGCVLMTLILHPMRMRRSEELEKEQRLVGEERALLEQQRLAYQAEVRGLEEAKQKLLVAKQMMSDRDAESLRRAGEVQHEERALERRVLDWEGRVARTNDDLREREKAVDQRVVKLSDFQRENAVLKADLRNLLVASRKQKLDQDAVRAEQRLLRERSDEVAELYLLAMEKAVSKAITANNFATCRDRLVKAIEKVQEIGFVVTPEREAGLMEQLRHDFEMEVREAMRKEEQARVKEMLREEERIRRDAERERSEKEREASKARKAAERAAEEKQRATEEAKRVQEQQTMLREMLRLAEEKGAKELELAHMRKQIGELEILKEQATAQADEAESLAVAAESAAMGALADAQKAVSNAQLTRSGHVYVISNVGSFGRDVFKVGSTRRSDPDDRIRELGDASVPFPFDVHMMIKCDNAPSLENALHRGLAKARMNRVNPRKEFFRTELAVICSIVKEHHGCEVDFVMDAEAAEWKQSQEMSETDAEYIESVYEKEAGVVAEVE